MVASWSLKRERQRGTFADGMRETPFAGTINREVQIHGTPRGPRAAEATRYLDPGVAAVVTKDVCRVWSRCVGEPTAMTWSPRFGTRDNAARVILHDSAVGPFETTIPCRPPVMSGAEAATCVRADRHGGMPIN